jgi:hypothetical protein
MPTGRTWTNLINYLLFQGGWFVCVLGAAAGHPWLAGASGFSLVVIHLSLVRNPTREGMLLMFSLLLGIFVDALHIGTGVLSFPTGSIHPSLPPPWILVLWLQFAMTLHYSLAWLTGRYWLGAVLGGCSGALAYWAGVRLGAAAFDDSLFRCLLQIGLCWAIVMVILIKVAEWTAPGTPAPTYRLFIRRLHSERDHGE